MTPIREVLISISRAASIAATSIFFMPIMGLECPLGFIAAGRHRLCQHAA